jgi:hypothetical protein
MGVMGSNPVLSTPQSLRFKTFGESFEKTRIQAGFWGWRGTREQCESAVLVRNSTNLSGDDFRGPHLDPPRVRAICDHDRIITRVMQRMQSAAGGWRASDGVKTCRYGSSPTLRTISANFG